VNFTVGNSVAMAVMKGESDSGMPGEFHHGKLNFPHMKKPLFTRKERVAGSSIDTGAPVEATERRKERKTRKFSRI